MTAIRLVARLVFVCCLLGASVGHAQQKDAAARVAYAEGRDAYQAGKYDLALEKFRLCYTLSGEPALLYNIATALQSLNRPGESADALEQYLRVRPDDPQRAELQKRIANLRLAQSLTDKDRQHAATQGQGLAPAVGPAAGYMSDAEADRVVGEVRDRERRRRKKLAIGLGVGLGAIAVGGITVGVVCGLGHCGGSESKDWDFGKNTITP